MRTVLHPWIATALGLATWSMLSAQTSPRPPGPLRFNVTNVSDSRTTNLSTCTLDLNVFGDAADDAMSVLRVRITKAVDELDRDLIMPQGNPSAGFSFTEGGPRMQALRTQLRLRSPSRLSGTIKLIEGEIDLFSPTIANGGKLTLPGFASRPSEPIQNPTLQKLGIEAVYLTRESYEARVQQMATAQKAGGGLEQLGPGLVDLFRGMLGNPSMGDARYAAYIYLKDSGNRVVGSDLVDGQGNLIRSRGRSSRGSMATGLIQQINLDAPLPDDSQLNLYVGVPEAVRSLPLKLENVALP